MKITTTRQSIDATCNFWVIYLLYNTFYNQTTESLSVSYDWLRRLLAARYELRQKLYKAFCKDPSRIYFFLHKYMDNTQILNQKGKDGH